MKKKRILSLLLAVLLTISIIQLPVEVSAAHENTYVNTGNYRADIIGVARTQIGYRETFDNKTKYGAWYGLDYQPWCAMYVVWCARQAKIPSSVLASTGFADPECFEIECKDGKEYTPVPGDLFFKKDLSHTGLVYHVDGEYFYTLEGNTNNDGSDNGTEVMCHKRKIADMYFGVYEESGVEAPAAPEVSTSQQVYSAGQTVRIQWPQVEGAVSYSVAIYRDSRCCYSGNVGDVTFFDYKSAKYGDYLVSVAAHYADGTIGFAQNTFDVGYAADLHVYYNANGGEVSADHQYLVVGGEGTVLRASASMNAANYGMIPVGAVVDATQIQNSGGYTWAKVSYGGSTGWCLISEGHCERVDCDMTESGDIIQYPIGDLAETTWSAGSGETKSLLDPQTASLSREFYTFAGWSLTPDGSGTVFTQDQRDISAEQIDPYFSWYDRYAQLYAIWEKTVSAIGIAALPDQREVYVDDELNAAGLKIQVKYADGTYEVIDSGFELSGFNSATPGAKLVTVTYRGKTANFQVTVKDRMAYAVEDDQIVITHYELGSGVVTVPAFIEGKPVKAIAPDAFAGCSQITGLILPAGIEYVGDGAFSGCGALSEVYYAGSREQWDNIALGEKNEALVNATLICNHMLPGDYDGNFIVDDEDVIYLLWHTLMPKEYPLTMSGDLDGNGIVDDEDVIYLLWHTLIPGDYPIEVSLLMPLEQEPAEEPTEEPSEEPVEEPTEEPSEEPVEEPTEEPAEEPVEEPTEEPAEEPVEEPTEEPAEEPVEEPTEEPVEEPIEEIQQEM